MKKLWKWISCGPVFLFMLSCTTVSYMGPREFVEFRSSDDVKSSEQLTLNANNKDLVTTYDHEFTYDAEGNLIKLKETEYFNRYSGNAQYVVWETEWKVIGGKTVPYRAMVNGDVFCEVEYEILEGVEENGRIYKDINSALYYKNVNNVFFGSSRQYWNVSLSNYPVPFSADEEFVRELQVFHAYFGYSGKNVLGIGFDNIVLKKYNYSYAELLTGFSKSFPYGSSQSARMQELAVGSNVNFAYEWQKFADKACPTRITFIARDDSAVYSHLEMNMEYNADGNRVLEEWIVVDVDKKDQENRTTVFKQQLSY